jgi:hypothetical protein
MTRFFAAPRDAITLDDVHYRVLNP